MAQNTKCMRDVVFPGGCFFYRSDFNMIRYFREVALSKMLLLNLVLCTPLAMGLYLFWELEIGFLGAEPTLLRQVLGVVLLVLCLAVVVLANRTLYRLECRQREKTGAAVREASAVSAVVKLAVVAALLVVLGDLPFALEELKLHGILHF